MPSYILILGNRVNKLECLEFLEKTKKNYKNHLLIINNKMDESFLSKNPVLLNKEKSLLGKWIYESHVQAKDIAGTIFYEELKSLHSSWCIEFNNICEVYQTNTKKSFISKNKIDEFVNYRVKAHYKGLESTSKQLEVLIDKISNRIHALPKSKFS